MVTTLGPDAVALAMDSAEKRRRAVNQGLDPSRRAYYGQFFTPSAVAEILVDLADLKGRRRLRVLDPGAGVGSLSAALLGRVLREVPEVTVELTTFEIDPELRVPLGETLDEWRAIAGQRLVTQQRAGDFLVWAATQLRPALGDEEPRQEFDLVLMNPPYKKISANSPQRALARAAGIQTTNLYTAFLAIGQALLAEEGQLLAITPRSFCNGTYFRDFRRNFFNEMAFRAIHVFESRKAAFAGDSVLQENVVFAAVKSAQRGPVSLTQSQGERDDLVIVREVPHDEVVRPSDPDFFINIVADEGNAEIARRMASLPSTLRELGLAVSTGRVVDFRVKEHLREQSGEDTVPLIYQGNIRAGAIVWPAATVRKAQNLAVGEATHPHLLPSGHYVVTKRFTAKEERRRVSAGLFDPEEVPCEFVAFENHTNVIHALGRPIELDMARGLLLFLNSSMVDYYFRQFSGHTQVNSGDLRSLRYPALHELVALGRRLGDQPLPAQEGTDDLVGQCVSALVDTGGGDPLNAQKRIDEAVAVLKALDLPREQQNERSALTLLAMLNLRPGDPWSAAEAPLLGITPMMRFFSEHYGKVYKPNTRETVRRQTVHQFVEAGLLTYNPEKPDRPVNSPRTVYQVEQSALVLLQGVGGREWPELLREYRKGVQGLRTRWAAEREMVRLPVSLPDGREVSLSPGGQNVLITSVVTDFCPRFVPSGQVLYIGDADEKYAVYEKEALVALGVLIEEHGKMPDLVVLDKTRNWLVLVEAVTSHGPVNAKRHDELRRLFANSSAGIVYVTTFLTRKAMAKYLGEIAWETEVWCADAPSHMIHFNGERFLGPYKS